MHEMLIGGGSGLLDKGPPVLLIDPSNLSAGSTALRDTSGRNITITNNGLVVADVGPRTGWKSMYFDAVNANRYFRIPNAGIPALTAVDHTAEFWWRPESFNGNTAPLFGQWKQVAGQGGFLLLETDSKFSLQVASYSENIFLVEANTTQAAGQWQHLAIVRQGNRYSLFRNGRLLGAGNAPAKANTGLDYFSGVYQGPDGSTPAGVPSNLKGWTTKGWMSRFAIYDYARYVGTFSPQ